MPDHQVHNWDAGSTQSAGAAAPLPRRKWWILAAVALVAVVGSVVWSIGGSRSPAKLNTVLLNHSPQRQAAIAISNSTSRPMVIWHPCYIERQQDHSVVAASGNASPILVPGSSGAPRRGVSVLQVQLTGTNLGSWRLLAPVTGYGLLAGVDSVFRKPPGWTLRSPLVRFALRHLSRTAASDWMEEAQPLPVRLEQEQRDAFMNLSQDFRSESDRWPTNVAELKDYAAAKGQPGPAGKFLEATFETSSEGRFTARFPGGGFMSFGAGSGGASIPPRQRAEIAERMARPRNAMLQRRNESTTFMFILTNFRSHLNRWPNSMKELQDFVRTHRQPAIPEQFLNAEFYPQPNGGVKVSYQDGHGSMSLN